MKSLLAIGLATIYGIALRIMFGFIGDGSQIMSITFLFIVPMIIGFLTVFYTPKEKVKTGTNAFFLPWLTVLAILIITIIFNIEGTICWILIYPIFSIFAGIGGIFAFHFRNTKPMYSENGDLINDDSENDDLEKPTTLNVSIFLLIPCVIGFVEGNRSTIQKDFNISKSVEISASTKEVWAELTNINQISNIENTASFSNMIGFPKHLRTTLDTLCVGGKRKAMYENGLYFDETISDFETEKRLVLDIKTDPNNIPPTVMDEHIVIGGKHVDILQDIYTIEKISENSCRLTLSSRFFINTPFNWYTSIWADYLMKDILRGQLNLIAARATAKNIK